MATHGGSGTADPAAFEACIDTNMEGEDIEEDRDALLQLLTAT